MAGSAYRAWSTGPVPAILATAQAVHAVELDERLSPGKRDATKVRAFSNIIPGVFSGPRPRARRYARHRVRGALSLGQHRIRAAGHPVFAGADQVHDLRASAPATWWTARVFSISVSR
ncbi:hypothetical protein LVY72_18550 [Arthrobacter sp. I2-34]|uniref:Uncharacterized protein n=1 Tax=Arthrobacter hankyongi TaxID=2904801 RepID=A0ABS9LB40_9MICC|nr:hypothetical protein [Arthrobacter hankyongi]MCG2623899.1 hypothetical protein [Arthrobacter hankyongi]